MSTPPPITSKNVGSYELILVLIITVITATAMVIAQSVSLLKTRESVSSLSTQKAFYTAEGALHETYGHLITNPTWLELEPTENYSDEYTIAGTTINRIVTKTSPTTYEVDITATERDYKRRLIGNMEITTALGTEVSTDDVDIIIILDMSSSLTKFNDDPFTVAKESAESFVSSFNNDPHVKVGVISFNNTPRIERNLTFDHQEIRNFLLSNELSINSGTNSPAALALAGAMLETQARPEARRVIVFFTDGNATRSLVNGPQASMYDLQNTCENEECDYGVEGGLRPDGLGNCCSNSTLAEADILKANGVEVYTILLMNPEILESSFWRPIAETTTLRVSSEEGNPPVPPLTENYTYFKHASIDNLDAMETFYTEISEEIGINTVTGVLDYEEAIPVP